MRSTHKNWFVFSLAAILLMAAASGCVRNGSSTTAATTPEPMDVRERAVIVHKDDGSRRYYRDDNGKLYYVDQAGAVHTIERHTRVETGGNGLYYIVDDDNVNYRTDNNGRLFYRDDSGRKVYIEESGSGHVIDPLPLLRGESYPMIENARSLDSCNASWRTCTARCYDAADLSNRRSCLGECDIQRERCDR
ncbi:MAG: hypothetical protein HQK81_14975 [Desulfovibrionaceae bacterium]|nr:hypothetical protein [Desulfovibrionaceae bacterium]MBF0515346.1 hypothetical protein [Desulfovibrionaceae bacterium]